ncbi:hypothetical protein CYMTET_32443, partial [Cymbomonas tetramitiformis]
IELFTWLRKLFNTHLSMENTANLVEFIMYIAAQREGQPTEGISTGEDKGSGIEGKDEEEWTAGRVDDIYSPRDSTVSMDSAETGSRVCRKLHRLKRRSPKAQLSRSEWVEVFTGSLTTFSYCTGILERKFEQGHFRINDALLDTYKMPDEERVAKQRCDPAEKSDELHESIEGVGNEKMTVEGSEDPLIREAPMLSGSASIFEEIEELQKFVGYLVEELRRERAQNNSRHDTLTQTMEAQEKMIQRLLQGKARPRRYRVEEKDGLEEDSDCAQSHNRPAFLQSPTINQSPYLCF